MQNIYFQNVKNIKVYFPSVQLSEIQKNIASILDIRGIKSNLSSAMTVIVSIKAWNWQQIFLSTHCFQDTKGWRRHELQKLTAWWKRNTGMWATRRILTYKLELTYEKEITAVWKGGGFHPERKKTRKVFLEGISFDVDSKGE